ncbi:hypothetical protein ACZ91_56350 [Streptomyces regensis]|nr:hypothetical protein ACZ91_56350 [Streptomyces regensis]
MSARTFAALRWRIIRHGPHDERGFGLVTGLVAAAGVVTVAVLAARAAVHPSWLTVAVSVFGLTWIVGPALLPTSAPVVDPRWFRTLPHSPHRIARDLAPSEAIAVGPVISAVALSGMVVLAAPHGTVAALVAVVAAGAQLFVLLWIGRWVSAALTRLLRSAAGLWLAAVQMSVLLAVSFAGWVPIAAWVLPELGHGAADVVTPSVPGAVPDVVQTVLFALPTGWGMAAVDALTASGSPLSVAGLLAALVLTGLLARRGWIALTARTVAQPPARMRSGIRARRRAAAARAHPRRGGPVRAVVDRAPGRGHCRSSGSSPPRWPGWSRSTPTPWTAPPCGSCCRPRGPCAPTSTAARSPGWCCSACRSSAEPSCCACSAVHRCGRWRSA